MDPRNFSAGREIPSQYYVDQPYFVVTPGGEWVCVLTTGGDREGRPGQHISATISADQGKTWSELIPIESPNGPDAGWAVPLITPSGRIYVFYTYNGDPVHAGRDQDDQWYFWHHTPPPGIVFERSDLHGWYAFKFSDDGGRTWSEDRYRIELPVTSCDRNRTCDTDEVVQLFWGIDRPLVMDSAVYISFTKMAKHFQQEGEGWLVRSDNILTEADPEKIDWKMLPAGDVGIRHPDFGSVQEEHNIVRLDDGQSLYCMYRTETGFPACSYSRDRGRTWSLPEPARYALHGNIMRTPRACPMVWRCRNAEGKYLFWFHNNGYKSYKNTSPPVSRNLVWLSGGVERDGEIHWSQPELIQYDDNTWRGSSYPDLIEEGGNYYISSTQKRVARIATIDAALLEELWNQDQLNAVAEVGLLLDLDREALRAEGQFSFDRLPRLDQGGGFSIGLWIRLYDLAPGRVLIDSTGGDAAGVQVVTGADDTLEVNFHDGRHGFRWTSDPGTMHAGQLQHVMFIVDGGPQAVSVVVDGRLCDGALGEVRLRGTGRFARTKYFSNYEDRCEPASEIGDVTGAGELSIPVVDEVLHLRLYDRYLRTSEAIGNWRAGLAE